MGDRTTVSLTVLASRKAEIAPFAKYADEEVIDANLHAFMFEEVNYGNLDFLDKLEEAGIAYDSNWSSGNEYGPGCRSCRFTPDGNIIIKEIDDDGRNLPVSELLNLLDKPVELREYILHRVNALAVLPWDNQEEYSKLYRTKQLLGLPDASCVLMIPPCP